MGYCLLRPSKAYFFPQVAKSGNLNIASLCSGYNTPWLALELLKIDGLATEMFACEVDDKVRAVLEHNFPHLRGRIFKDVFDIMGDKLKSALRGVTLDLLTAGFPCQPFSCIGGNQGEEDKARRGVVVYKIIQLIELLLPRAFVLENVEGLVKQHWDTFCNILDLVQNITDDGKPVYKVDWQVLNSRTHSGQPHNRPRVFVVGVKATKSSDVCFEFPGQVEMIPLNNVLTKHVEVGGLLPRGSSKNTIQNFHKCLEKIGGPSPLKTLQKGFYVAHLGGSDAYGVTLMEGICPCLTKTRAEAALCYSFHHRRPLSTKDMFRIMAVPDDKIERPSTPVKVTERMLRGMIGNSMDTKLMARIIFKVLKYLRFASKGLRDPVEI